MPGMNPEVKAQWVAALRSDEYKQGIGQLTYLNDGEEYHCCLGVLCDLAVKAGLDIEITEQPYRGRDWIARHYDEASACLPASVLRWSGLSQAFPDFSAGEHHIDLTARNDNGTPFTEIADLIEKYL